MAARLSRTKCHFCLVFVSSDTLWEQAAAEVHSRETDGGEEDGGETVSERTVFLMGSKAGVCLPSCQTSRQLHVLISSALVLILASTMLHKVVAHLCFFSG